MYKSLIRVFLTSISFDERGGILLFFLPTGASIHTYQLALLTLSVLLNYNNLYLVFKKQNFQIISFIVFFTLFLIYSYFNFSSLTPTYATYKNDLLLWNISIIFFSFLSINNNFELRELIYLVILQIIISYIFVGIDLHSNTRLGAGEPIVAGRIGGIVILYSLFVYNDRKFLFSIFLFSLGLISIFLSGTRTVILTIVLATFVYIIIYDKKKALKNIIAIIVFLIFSIWLILYFRLIDENLTSRLLSVFYSKEGYSSTERFEQFKLAYRLFLDKPFLGHGTGAFGYYWSGFDQRDYPHNLLLELLLEYGIIGTILFAWLLLFIFKVLRNIYYSYFYPLLFSMYIFALLSSTTSLDMPNQFILFQAFAYVLISYKCEIYELSMYDLKN